MIHPVRARQAIPLLIISLAWLAAVSWYGSTQRPVSQNGGKGWDGRRYHSMFEQAREGRRIAEEKPYVYRVATPMLAAMIPGADPRSAFHAVNLASMLVLGWLLYLIQARLGVRPGIAVFLTVLFYLQWHAPLRQQFYDSFNVDAASLVFCALLLLLHLALRPGPGRLAALSAVTFAGVFFRESVIFATFAVWAAGEIEARGGRPGAPRLRDFRPESAIRGIPILAGAAGIACTRLLVDGHGPYNYFLTVLYYLYHKPMPVLAHAFFNAYGPLIILPLVFHRQAAGHLRRHPFLWIYPAITFLLGWTAGGDTTRINFWGFLGLLPLIGLVLSDLRIRTFGVGALIALEALTTRMFFPFPDYPNDHPWRIPVLTNLGDRFPVFDLWSELANPRVLMISLFQYALLTLAAFWWFHRNGKEAYLAPGRPEAEGARPDGSAEARG
jgi:hypothetical protein